MADVSAVTCLPKFDSSLSLNLVKILFVVRRMENRDDITLNFQIVIFCFVLKLKFTNNGKWKY